MCQQFITLVFRLCACVSVHVKWNEKQMGLTYFVIYWCGVILQHWKWKSLISVSPQRASKSKLISCSTKRQSTIKYNKPRYNHRDHSISWTQNTTLSLFCISWLDTYNNCSLFPLCSPKIQPFKVYNNLNLVSFTYT